MNTMRIEAARVNNDTIRIADRASIRAFMEQAKPLLTGRVLDFGCGKQPYRDCVAGEYFPYDKGDGLIEGRFAAVMCNQVTQYLDPIGDFLRFFRTKLQPGGALVMTYATNWAEVEVEDLHRFTRSGMEKLLTGTGFAIERHERRLEINLSGFIIPIGYGVVARV